MPSRAGKTKKVDATPTRRCWPREPARPLASRRAGREPCPLRIWRAPAVRALLIQCGAFAADPGRGVPAGPRRPAVDVLPGAALVQGLLAAGLTLVARPGRRGGARSSCCSRWRCCGALALRCRRGCSWRVFLFLLALYWSTFRTQVPYYPSGRRVWDAVAAPAAARAGAVRVIDIGSGLGGLVLDLARRRPESTLHRHRAGAAAVAGQPAARAPRRQPRAFPARRLRAPRLRPLRRWCSPTCRRPP